MPFYKQFKKKDNAKKPDEKLWPVFSLFIRLRDSNENGYVKCITCGAWRYFRDGDCGHGVGRQHMGTKYDETNNHFQCKPCNGPGEGRKDVYKEEVNKRYGASHWDMLHIKAKSPCKWGRFEFEMMTLHYMEEIKKLLKGKTLKPQDYETLKKFLE